MDSLLRIPDWSPLERALNTELGAAARGATSAFRFIGFVHGPADVGELRVYQHARTRVHVTLDVDGRAYRYFAEMDGYGFADLEQTIQTAIAGYSDGA
jgi:hypothetical protein